MKATETLTLYNEREKVIIAEVYEGNQYFIPENVSVFIGSVEGFLQENTDYKFEEDEL